MSKPARWECPLDISAYYFGYPAHFVAWMKARGYFGYIDDYHKRLFAKANPR